MSQRPWALPGAAVVAVAALMAFQLALGGGDFVPAAVADPCTEPAAASTAGGVDPASTDLDQVTQAVVVAGVTDAACNLGLTREELLLALPSPTDRAALAQRIGKTDAELLAAVKAGMLASVEEMDRAGRLPKASALVNAYAGELGLSGLAEQAARSVPPEMIDGFLPTGQVVRRAIDGLDLAELLDDAQDPAAWEPAVRGAIREAAIAEVREQVLDRIPDSLGDLFGG